MSIKLRSLIGTTWRQVSKGAWVCVTVPAEQEAPALVTEYDLIGLGIALAVIGTVFVLAKGVAAVWRATEAGRPSDAPA